MMQVKNTALEAIKADSSKTGTTITKVEGQTSPITVTKAGAYAYLEKINPMKILNIVQWLRTFHLLMMVMQMD